MTKLTTAILLLAALLVAILSGCESRARQQEADPVSIEEEEPSGASDSSTEPVEAEEEDEEEPEDVADDEEVEQTVTAFLEAVRSGSSERMREYIDYKNLLQLQEGQSDANLLALGGCLQYEILDIDTQGNAATVSVRMVSIDMKQLMRGYINQMMELEFNNAQKEEDRLPDDVMEGEYERLFRQMLEQNASVTVEQVVDLQLSRSGNTWRIQTGEDMRNGLFGDFWRANNQNSYAG